MHSKRAIKSIVRSNLLESKDLIYIYIYIAVCLEIERPF